MVATCNTPEEMMAFYCLLTEFVNIPAGSPGRLILDGDGITDVSTDLEPTVLPSTGNVQELVDPKPMPGILVEKESKVDMQKMIVSKLDPTTTMDDGISLAG